MANRRFSISLSFKLLYFEWPFILFGLLMSFWSSFGQTFFISLFSAEIRNELNLTHGTFGTLYAVATLTSAMCLFWLGKSIDRFAIQSISVFTLAATSLSAFYFSFVWSASMLLIGLFFLRLSGQGMMYLVYSTAIAKRYAFVRGKALALSGFGLNIAEAFFPLIVVATLTSTNWKYIWLILSIFSFLSFAPFISSLTGKPSREKEFFKVPCELDKQPKPQISRGAVIRDYGFWIVIVWLTIIPAFTVTGIFFHQILISELKNIELIDWAGFYLWYAVAALTGGILSGIVVDRYTAQLSAFVTQVPMVLACYFLIYGENTFSTFLFFIFFGLASGTLQPMINSLLAERYGVRWLGDIKSLIMPLNVVASALSPVIMGLMIDYGASLKQLIGLLLFASGYSLLSSFIFFNIFQRLKPSYAFLK
ncbi:MAG: hypothetical protein CBC42_01290 [Betaproteobacteria bacterium TMED82]|nr:MAG: hypothetical protein CBC42_01290 [Betaproteobacteria bacterium TMED82]|tara:strand:- start:6811 stop:8076 length:1266 start_codon:yes stop_codon:yes gene_type:complete